MRYDEFTTEMKDFRRRVIKADDVFELVKEEMEQGRISRDQLLALVCDDPNLFSSAVVKQCVDGRLLDRQQLVDNGIDPNFVEMLGTVPEDVLPDVGRIDGIGENTTEVYLWGIPKSGKTCALGTILTAARSVTVTRSFKVNPCQGLLYQMILSQIFQRENAYCTLPGRTLVDANFAISTVIEDLKGKDHPVTFIDMAGELFCSMLWNDLNMTDQVTDNHKRALQEFEEVLITRKSNNPKYHFFIIEYCEGDNKYKRFNQDTYLEHGLRYLETRGVLNDANDGLFVLVTKTDLVGRAMDGSIDGETYLVNFLNEKYPNFFRLLDRCCKDHHLCGGKLPLPIPFDIGEVCFRNFCKVKTARANKIIEILMDPPRAKKRWWRI